MGCESSLRTETHVWAPADTLTQHRNVLSHSHYIYPSSESHQKLPSLRRLRTHTHTHARTLPREYGLLTFNSTSCCLSHCVFLFTRIQIHFCSNTHSSAVSQGPFNCSPSLFHLFHLSMTHTLTQGGL